MGRVIDALEAIPKQSDYTDLFTNVVVVSGPWAQSNMPKELVLIGLTAEGDSESGGVQSPRTMGHGGFGSVQEDYGVVCQVICWTGDSGSAAQKSVRDRAGALLAAFEITTHLNPTLTGLIVPPPSGQPLTATVERVALAQGIPRDIDGAVMGREAAYGFTVHVLNSLHG